MSTTWSRHKCTTGWIDMQFCKTFIVQGTKPTGFIDPQLFLLCHHAVDIFGQHFLILWNILASTSWICITFCTDIYGPTWWILKTHHHKFLAKKILLTILWITIKFGTFMFPLWINFYNFYLNPLMFHLVPPSVCSVPNTWRVMICSLSCGLSFVLGIMSDAIICWVMSTGLFSS